jgi:hypothetical protein
MKRNLLFTLLLFVAVFTSCNHNEDIVVEHSRVTLEASHNSATRVYFDGQKSTWEDGDRLSVAVDGLEGVYHFDYDAATESKFVCDNLVMPAEQSDLYAFYGIEAEDIDVANKCATVNLGAAEQIQSAQEPTKHIAEYDVLYGKAESVKGNNIQIAMNHTIAAVKINLTNSLQDTPTIKNITITAPEEVALAGEYVINPSSDEIALANDTDAVNSVNLTFEEPVLLGTDGCVAWIATAPVALVEGDNLVIDITTADGKLYRCTKQIPAAGVTFAAGSIMTTNITLGGNATIVEQDSPANPDLPATIEIVIDPEAGITLPDKFPTSSKDNVKLGKFEFSGYEFNFDSSVPFYYNASKSALDVIRFDGITKTKTASILLPRIDGYILNKVVLASIDDNRKLRNCCFAVLGSLSDEITTQNSQILTSKHTEFDVPSPYDDCYIYVFHKNADTGKKADLSYISLSYSKIE